MKWVAVRAAANDDQVVVIARLHRIIRQGAARRERHARGTAASSVQSRQPVQPAQPAG